VRIPIGNNFTDNFSLGGAGNLVAGVDLETGHFLRVFGPDPTGLGLVQEVFRHPDTGVEFPGYIFPFWTSILEVVKVGSKAFGDLKTIGWDVALTEDGPCLIEANSRYAMDVIQVVMDCGLKQNFQELLGGG